MSLRKFEKAMELAKQIKGYSICDHITEKMIEKTEEVFGFKLSKQHYLFYKIMEI